MHMLLFTGKAPTGIYENKEQKYKYTRLRSTKNIKKQQTETETSINWVGIPSANKGSERGNTR